MLSERTSRALAGVSKATLQKGVRVKHLFRIMTHYPDLWMQAYANIYANRGALTKGVNDVTLDGMCQDRIENLVKMLIDGKYEPAPAKRVFIPKKNGKRRPLGIPDGDSKLVQEVIRLLLETVYEPTFSGNSHGFRPERSCHTALLQVKEQWKGIKWIVDMDISVFYDNIDHEKLVAILEKKIDDNRFIKLIKSFLKAGYLDNWKFHNTYSGTPQGGICSPILANIFLHELDEFVEGKMKDFNRGKVRKRNPDYYHKLDRAFARRRELKTLEKRGGCMPWVIQDLKNEVKEYETDMRSMPSNDPNDPDYKRLHYVRYADDFALAVTGSKEDARTVAQEVEEFLGKDLNLQIAQEKSGIHHAKDGFYFLGYHASLDCERQRLRKRVNGRNRFGKKTYGTQRSHNSQIFLQLPKEKVWSFCRDKGFLAQGNKPTSRGELLNLSDYEIVSTFNAEMRGFANYYAFAPKENLYIMEWAGLTSLFKTLANKHKTSSHKMRRSLKRGDEHVLHYKIGEKSKAITVFKVKHRAEPNIRSVDAREQTFKYSARTEITQRMNAGKCEYCGKTGGYFEVHHIRKVKDLLAKKNKTPWEVRMCARNRKTMVLCIECHDLLHKGELQGWRRDFYAEMESPVQ